MSKKFGSIQSLAATVATVLLALLFTGCEMGPEEFTGEEEAGLQENPAEFAPAEAAGDPTIPGDFEGTQDDPGATEGHIAEADPSDDAQPTDHSPTCEDSAPNANGLCGDSDKGHGSPQPLVPSPLGGEASAEAEAEVDADED